MVRRAFLDDGRQQELEERGYTVIRLLDPEEARQALDEVRALQPSDGFRPGAESLAEYHCTFLDPDRRYKRDVDDLTRRWFEARTCALLDGYRLLTSNIYVKGPGTGRFEVHQNWPVTDDIRDTTLTLWCPLVDVGPDNGTINVVPGSHKIVPDTYTVGAPKFFESFYDDLIDRWLEPLTLAAGECVLFDDSLLHWSEANHSDTPRWSVQLVFMPEEKTPVIYHYDLTSEPPRFELYEVDPDFFVERGVDQLLQRPDGLRLVGTAEDRSVTLDEAAFARLMAEGPRIRELVYAGAEVDVAFAAAFDASSASPVASSIAAPVAAGTEPLPAPRRRRWWDLRR